MSCDNVITVQDLETDKKHSTFYREVITGKAGGTGADIDSATNAVTGQTQATLPKVLSNVGFSPAGFDFTTGGTLTERDKAIFYQADGNWYSWGGTLPKVVPPASSPASTGGIADNAWNVSTSAFMYRDWEGFTAELLSQGGVSDNGRPDELGNSQRVKALVKISGRKFSSVNAMISSSENLSAGDFCSTGATQWRFNGGTSGTISDFSPLSPVDATDFGAVGDGIADDTVAFMGAVSCCEITGATLQLTRVHNLNNSVITITKPFDIVSSCNGLLLNCSINVNGSVSAEIPLTANAAKNQSVIYVPTTELNVGDMIFVKSSINCLSTDAGADRLGAATGISYFAEMCDVIAKSSNSITVSSLLLWDYPITSGQYSGGRIASTLVSVKPVRGAMLNVNIKGKSTGSNAVINLLYCRDVQISGRHELSGTGYGVVMTRCLDCVVSDYAMLRPRYATGFGSVSNTILTMGSTNCGAKNCTVDGGYQAVDITYNTAQAMANPSLFCYAHDIIVRNGYEGATTHGGCYAGKFSNITAYGCFNGIRVRSKFDSISNATVISSAGTPTGFGVYVAEGYNHGTRVSNVTTNGVLYGVQISQDDPEGNYSLPGNVVVDGISATGAVNAVQIIARAPSAMNSGMTISNVTAIACTRRGVLVESYNNGITITNVTTCSTSDADFRGAVEFYGNCANIRIGNVVAADGVVAVRGPSTIQLITDTTTFPAGDSEANLSIGAISTLSATPILGVPATSAPRFKGIQGYHSGYYVGSMIVRAQSAGYNLPLVGAEDFSGTLQFAIDRFGQFVGNRAVLSRDAIANAADLDALKSALRTMFSTSS